MVHVVARQQGTKPSYFSKSESVYYMRVSIEMYSICLYFYKVAVFHPVQL